MTPRSKKTLVALMAAVLAASLLPQSAVAGAAPVAPEVDPRLERQLEPLAADDPYAAFIHFRDREVRTQLEVLRNAGLSSAHRFASIDVHYVIGAARGFRTLMHNANVSYLEANHNLKYFGDTGPWATRVRIAQEPVSGGPYKDASGDVVDGSGIGVAIVDSGIDGTHPDLEARVARNFKMACTTLLVTSTATEQCAGPIVAQEAPHTDLSGGHGTHVAGIVAGDGTASQGTYTGVAPGADLFGYSTGEVISVLFAAEAFNHILTNYESLTPRIRVVNNSWGNPGGNAYNPNDVLSKLTKRLVDKGVTVAYAAGNDAGNGSADKTSSTAKDPTPGVVTAGNYEDRNTGERNAAMYSQSSRGRSGQPSTYPDVAAPGAAIMSTCRPNLPVCASGATTAHTKDYASLFGTSMAAPHVAGIAAMLYQADPGLTPAQVEDLLLDTAHKFTAGAAYEADPQNPGGTTSFDKGAGLADAVAALRALGLTGSGTSASTVQVVDGDGGDFPGPGALDIVGLNVSNEESGLRYILEVRDIDDAPLPSMSLRVTQNVDGKNFLTNLTVTAAGITAGTGAQATQIVRDTAANTVSFLVPWANLGNPSTNSPAHNVFVSSFVGGVVDVAPGGPGAEVLVAPRHGAPYTVRPTEETAPTPPPTPTPTPTTSTSPSPSPTPSPTGSPTPIPTGDVIFEDEATIELFSPVGVTQAEFLLTCAEPANTQGLDGYVFELPEATSAREVATLTGSENVHDLDMYFYDADCASSGDAAATTAADEIAFVPNGTKWIFAHSFDGVGTTATLKVYQGEAVPEPTPTPTVTPGDFPFGDRGVYPAEPNDPLFPADPDLPEIIGGQWGMRKIKAPEAWQEVQATGHEVKVAVLDTGLDLNHPDFDCPGKVEVIANSDFIGDGNGPEDGAGHGTHVAGIVGACTNNGEGVVGVAPDATIMPIQVLDADGSGDPLTTLPGGIRAATDAGANVINMSLGTLPVFTPIDVLIEDVFPEVDEAVEYATTHGVVVIAAAGNESFPLCSYPAIIEDIVCVGSTDSRDVNSYFGNFPVNDDDQDTIGAGLMAPGGSGQVFCDVSAENIVSTYAVELDPCDEGFAGYTGLDGTSMAAPHVAGVAALVYDRLGERTEANGQAVIDALISSTDDLYAPGWDPASGYGRVNALNAVRAVDAVEPPLAAGTTTQITDDSATSGQFSDAATIAAELTDEDGNPISGSELAFELVGSGGTKSWTATTDENGVAAANVDLDLAPGTYTLAAGFSGVADEYEPSADLGSFQIVKEAATLSFGSGSATSGQYSDTAAVSALLTDDDGTPLAGVEVVYELAGQTATAITGADGVAATTLNLVDQAGAYQLKASYPENAFHQAAQTASDFTIRAEDSRTTLQVPGPGSDRVYRATVVETDGGTGLAGVVVEFLANGNRIGTATTNANGVATITAKFAKKTVYEAVFAGDAYYLRSSARYQEK